MVILIVSDWLKMHLISLSKIFYFTWYMINIIMICPQPHIRQITLFFPHWYSFSSVPFIFLSPLPPLHSFWLCQSFVVNSFLLKLISYLTPIILSSVFSAKLSLVSAGPYSPAESTLSALIGLLQIKRCLVSHSVPLPSSGPSV